MRVVLLAAGHLCVALGVAGIFLPLLPTTPFLLLAAWCYARASKRFYRWLVEHPRLGPVVWSWRRHRAIPLRAKVLATVVLTSSFGGLLLTRPLPLLARACILGGLAIGFALLWSRPSGGPAAEAEAPHAEAAHFSRLGVALGALLALSGTARAEDPPRLTIQKKWRLLAVGVAVDPALAVQPLLVQTARAIERELPGLEVRFDAQRWRVFPAPAAGGPTEVPNPRRADWALVRYAVRMAEEASLAPETYDVVFVLSPLYRGRYFGYSHLDAQTKAGIAVRGCSIQTAPARLIVSGATDALDGKTPPGFPKRRPLLPDGLLRRGLRSLLDASQGPLSKLLGAPLLREAIIAPTLAHELGHFFAAGDLNIRDGYQAPWLRHATGPGPKHNPDGHAVECCMYKGRSLGFYAEKAWSMRGKLVVFCDPCRKRLGCAP